ncbi:MULTISPECIES: DUF6126 family protein [unclassified Streptomyces]|uniref:DUF6126 family protein n=1 Tax=unclassified Streptomyces TaxID=2593676 RepID=UPI000CD4BF92|nr:MULTISPECIES: DUF6126 family protein [unclassified Streptomyces]
MPSETTDDNERKPAPEPSVGHGEERGEGRFPRGLLIRLSFYLIGSHVFAAFLYLLFVVGK